MSNRGGGKQHHLVQPCCASRLHSASCTNERKKSKVMEGEEEKETFFCEKVKFQRKDVTTLCSHRYFLFLFFALLHLELCLSSFSLLTHLSLLFPILPLLNPSYSDFLSRLSLWMTSARQQIDCFPRTLPLRASTFRTRGTAWKETQQAEDGRVMLFRSLR